MIVFYLMYCSLFVKMLKLRNFKPFKVLHISKQSMTNVCFLQNVLLTGGIGLILILI